MNKPYSSITIKKDGSKIIEWFVINDEGKKIKIEEINKPYQKKENIVNEIFNNVLIIE